MADHYRPDPVFDRLGQDLTGQQPGAPFYDPVEAAAFPDHVLRYRNQRWAEKVGLGGLDKDEWIAHFGRFEPLSDNLEQPLALRYHGHQFRSYNPEIGDGRGFLFGQLRDDQNRLLDLGTKGSGQTPYSRFGDGRLTLKGGVREVLATEMLEALGVYTSKSFSLIETGEALERNDEPSPTRSSVLVRLSHSHVRFGAFQRLAFEKNDAALAALADYCIRYFYPALEKETGEARISSFYRAVVARTARLVAQWMSAGFVHGVLNTDNMNVTGESFDYGPWRFAPAADPNFTAAYFDQMGLYAFGRQAEAGAWNLAQLGGALARLCDADVLTETLRGYGDQYETAMADEFFRRLGLVRTGPEDRQTVTDFLRWMTASGAPFEQVFFDWFCGARSASRAQQSPAKVFYATDEFAVVRDKLTGLEPARPARLDDAYFEGSGPCSMLIDEVEAIWDPIAADDDWAAFTAKLEAIWRMREAYDFDASVYDASVSSSAKNEAS